MPLIRRQILTAAAALATAPGRGVRASTPERKVGFAIVGLGGYGLGVILPQFANCRYSRLAALVSGDPAKARAVAASRRSRRRRPDRARPSSPASSTTWPSAC